VEQFWYAIKEVGRMPRVGGKMVVEEQVEDLAIVSDGSGGYLVVEILGRASTYQEAKDIFEEELEGEPEGEEDEEDDNDSD
jgi:hypothetical protein